jgi:hypothetical protein
MVILNEPLFCWKFDIALLFAARRSILELEIPDLRGSKHYPNIRKYTGAQGFGAASFGEAVQAAESDGPHCGAGAGTANL